MKITITLALIVINMFAFGQVPSSQVSNYVETESKAWKISFSVNIPTSSDSGIVVISNNPIAVNQTFSDKVYKIGERINPSLKVVTKFQKGTQSFTLKALSANTTYYLGFLSFNNKSNVVNYRKSDVYSVKITTKGKNYGNYYKSLDTNRAVFLSQLTALLQNHTMRPYVDFRDIAVECHERDTFFKDSSKKYVICDYSDQIAIYNSPFSFSKTNFNREHTLPKNWMNFKFQSNDSLENVPEGADHHNLTFAEANVNSARSDYAMDIVTSNIVNYGKAKLNNSSTFSQRRFEPQDKYKGNAARCKFYTMLAYNGTNNKIWGFKKDLKANAQYQLQTILKTWARNDTPDNIEIARHEWIAEVQGSRNPFIDFPDWIDCINFDDITQLATCKIATVPTTSINILERQWDVWFSEYSQDKYILKYFLNEMGNVNTTMYNLQGTPIRYQAFNGSIGENSEWLDVSELSSGTYILHIQAGNLLKTMKLTKF
jgi:endonuclease I